MARGPGGMRRGLGHQPSGLKGSFGSTHRLGKRHATREWNDVLHVDPDEVGQGAVSLALSAAGHARPWGMNSGLHGQARSVGTWTRTRWGRGGHRWCGWPAGHMPELPVKPWGACAY